MFILCEEIEIAQEFETCKEINTKWPHLVEHHLASLHEDIRDRVRSKWTAHTAASRTASELNLSMEAIRQRQLMAEYNSLNRGVYGASTGHPFSLTGLNLGFGL